MLLSQNVNQNQRLWRKRRNQEVKLRDVKSFLQGQSCKTNVILKNISSQQPRFSAKTGWSKHRGSDYCTESGLSSSLNTWKCSFIEFYLPLITLYTLVERNKNSARTLEDRKRLVGRKKKHAVRRYLVLSSFLLRFEVLLTLLHRRSHLTVRQRKCISYKGV